EEAFRGLPCAQSWMYRVVHVPSGTNRGGQMARLHVDAARTHAAERCANAVVHTFSCAPNLSGSKGSQMTTTSADLAATPCPELGAVWRAEATAPWDLGRGGALGPVSQQCLSRRRSAALSARGWPGRPTYRRSPTSSRPPPRLAPARRPFGYRCAPA